MKKQVVPKTLERSDGVQVVYCGNLFIAISRMDKLSFAFPRSEDSFTFARF